MDSKNNQRDFLVFYTYWLLLAVFVFHSIRSLPDFLMNFLSLMHHVKLTTISS